MRKLLQNLELNQPFYSQALFERAAASSELRIGGILKNMDHFPQVVGA